MCACRITGNIGEFLMEPYPDVLLPHQEYCQSIPCEDILYASLVRETQQYLYALFGNNFSGDDIIQKITAPQHSKEVFELSLFLYGYYNETHVGMRIDDKTWYNDWDNTIAKVKTSDIVYKKQVWFPLFLQAIKLYKQEIEFEGDNYILSFKHKPSRANYWHFQLCTKNNATNDCIQRDKGNKRLAKHLFERVITQAIYCDKSAIVPFQHDCFDKVLNQH
jgi:hypothetical protein